MHMYHAFRLAGRAGRVDEEQRKLGVQRRRCTRRPDRAYEFRVRQLQQIGFGMHCDPGRTRGSEDRLQRRIRQFMTPAVPLFAPHDVIDSAVLHHDHGVYARRHRHQRGSDRGTYPAGVAGRKILGVGEFLQRASNAAHHVAALHRDLACQRLVDGAEQRRDALIGQCECAQRVVHDRAGR